MNLTTSDVIGYVTQGIRARYGTGIDANAAIRDWLNTHDTRATELAAAFPSNGGDDT